MLDAYDAIGEKAKSVLGSPYEVCFQDVIVETARQSKMFLGEDPTDEMFKKMLDEGLG